MTDVELIARVDAIAPIVLAGRDDAESNGRLSADVVEAMRGAGFTKLFAPKSLGGLEADPVTVSKITEGLARLDIAAAWFVMVANGARLAAARFPESMVEAVWGKQGGESVDTIAAASGNNPFVGEPVEGGYVLRGSNGFVSGCHHADWLMSPCLINGELRLVMVPMADAEIVDNWHVLGLRGSGSNDVRLDDVFVPASLTAGMNEMGSNKYYQGKLYKCPGRIVFATYVPAALVLAERALAEVDALARNKTPYATDRKLKHRSIAQVKYGKALATQRAAYGYYYAAMDECWERANSGMEATDDQKADLYLAGTHAVQSSAEVVRLAADVAGTSTIFDNSPLQRIVRDMEVFRHHGFANESRYGSVSQLKWGAELDYPLMLR